MPDTSPLLFEIGSEELPPGALRGLSEALADALRAGLAARGLGFGEATPYATPRRLAVHVEAVEKARPGRDVERRGPRLEVAFDAQGKATRAALGFARSCGVPVEALDRLETGDGAWLLYRGVQAGEPTPALLPGVVAEALARLPLPRRMRWSDSEVEFLRPVHWAVLLFGSEVVETEVLGVATGRATRGHRFHHPAPIPLDTPADYADALRRGRVIAHLDTRRDLIRRQVAEAAATLGGRPVGSDALLEEVSALVEWPVALPGSFDPDFLELPAPVLEAAMTGHQRCFPVAGPDGGLLARFVAVANLESRDPDTVREGNERVIRPRLRDAAFFFHNDLRTPLAARRAGLEGVLFQEGLGTLHEKSERVSRLSGRIAAAMGEAPETVRLARRAGLLCKCDLLTEMVGEFPELQGVMGAEYARRGGEPEALATALAEAYLPRHAGDALPASAAGRALAVADRLDTLAGIFGIGQAPSGDRDPFALRRAALGVLRILVEGEMDLDLGRLLAAAAEELGPKIGSEDVAAPLEAFLVERLRAWFAGQGVPATVFAAVHARRPSRPLDFAKRVRAVNAFRRLPEARGLAAANKRIHNLLRRAEGVIPERLDEALLSAPAERGLAERLAALRPAAGERLEAGDYHGALRLLATFRDPVDAFFDQVLVMDEDAARRGNRLALIRNVRALFLAIADVSLLQDW